jgi:hydrogenase large subunit
MGKGVAKNDPQQSDCPVRRWNEGINFYIDYIGKDKDLLAVKDKVVSLVRAKDTYPFTPRFKPDEYCVKDPDIVIHAVKHYIDALRMHAKARNMGAIWGGRTPHYMNIVVGGGG